MKINLHEIFPEYELIDCGNGLKLESFGEITLIRQEVTAVNKPVLSISEWRKLADAEFIEKSKNKGEWIVYKSVPEKWNILYNSEELNIVAELSLTKSKHIGIFPEQILNWNYIYDISKKYKVDNFLNLFGYTGISSIAAAFNIDRVTHIDSIKKVVDWTKRNADLNTLNNIRCITEDASKFVLRERKRKNVYQGIILDPPAIGVGANREKWVFENNIDELLAYLTEILDESSFVIMNFYSHTVNEKFIHRLILTYFREFKIDFAEKVFGLSRYGEVIDHGYFVRIRK
ncbi:MAG: oxidoreductase [Marinilabiliales bacterium]|nr:MAG: oxidoreductase [Marinilabiliales bacterium]